MSSSRDSIARSPRRRIDLTAAAKVVGDSQERALWLEAMLQPGGMSPGASSRAHARAFRFAGALMRAGYLVTEGPFGPRGGRRFTLDSYAGVRAGLVYRLKGYRGCSFEHTLADCDCFDALTEKQLKLVTTLRRKVNSVRGTLYGTDRIAALIVQHEEQTLRNAIALYVEASGDANGGPAVEVYLALMVRHDVDVLRLAIELFTAAGGTSLGGPPVEGYLVLLARHNLQVLRVAVKLFAGNGGSRNGAPTLGDLIDMVQAAIV